MSVETARAILRERLESRERNLLALAHRTIFDRPGSPYFTLLRAAGCEYGDLARLVGDDGVEGALATLFRAGVYLTVEEFKGRRPVERGSLRFTVGPGTLRNPLADGHVLVRSSGSRGFSAPVPVDLAFVTDHAVNTYLTLDACGGVGWAHAHYGVPGGAAIVNVLEFCKGGHPPARWFAQVDPSTPGIHPRYVWSGRALRWGARAAGVALPPVETVSLGDPTAIARWMSATRRAGGVPHLWTYASAAVRVSQAALEAGIDLEGAQFTMGGEPSTAARQEVVRRAGATGWPRYGATETDIIAFACQAPGAPDDMHLLHDRRAVIQPGGDDRGARLPAATLLFTSLLLSDPLVLLNVSLGDQAVMAETDCGCPLERLGWRTHVRDVRSFEKLTAGGMAFLDVDVIRVLEGDLPARFGGSPMHYQLVEDEGPDGRPRLRLRVDPAVGPLDPARVIDAFLDGIGRGSGIERVMSLQWRDAGWLTVERSVPLTTRSGKVLHLHQRQAPLPASP
jgi:hypothetical protein